MFGKYMYAQRLPLVAINMCKIRKMYTAITKPWLLIVFRPMFFCVRPCNGNQSQQVSMS